MIREHAHRHGSPELPVYQEGTSGAAVRACRENVLQRDIDPYMPLQSGDDRAGSHFRSGVRRPLPATCNCFLHLERLLHEAAG